jgi:hypothetical protein
MKVNNGKLTVTGPIVKREVEIPLDDAHSLPMLDRNLNNQSPRHIQGNQSERTSEQPVESSH